MGDGMRSPHLQRLEMEAYTAVLRALAATQMDWVRLSAATLPLYSGLHSGL